MVKRKRIRTGRPSLTDEGFWRRWRRDINFIELAVQDLVIDDHLFRVSMEMLGRTERIKQGATGYQWILRTYGRAVVVGVRRMLDRDWRSISLLNLLRLLEDHNRIVSLRRFTRPHLRHRHDRQGWKDVARKEFRDLVDGDTTHLPKRVVRDDLATLRRHWKKLERVTHKRIAHYEPKKPIGKEPLWSNVHDAVRALEALTIRYIWLLRQVDVTSGLLPFEYRKGGEFYEQLEAFWSS